MTTIIARRLVMIEWLDSLGCGACWSPVPADLEAKPLTCFSVGWIIAENDAAVVVAPHMHPADETRSVSESAVGDMTIPRAAIVRMADLNEG